MRIGVTALQRVSQFPFQADRGLPDRKTRFDPADGVGKYPEPVNAVRDMNGQAPAFSRLSEKNRDDARA